MPRAEARRGARARPRLVIFTPLPPMPTGIADYASELLPGLARRNDCVVVVEDGFPGLQVPDGVGLLSLSQYEGDEERLGAALHLFHLGNNADHVYMLPALARHPGLVVLHDPGLHNLLDNATAALGDQDAYCAAVEAEYGAPGRVLAAQWRNERLRDRQMLFEMPMLRQVLGPARHVIVHSRHACHKVLREAPDTPVTIAPHQFVRPAGPGGRATMRKRLGIGADEVVFLSLGFVSYIKRVDTALRALARIADRLPPFRYVIAGEVRREDLDVEALAERLGLSRHVLVTGFVPEADFFPMIDMADMVINLRYPVSGETSGTLIRALGSGACVVVVDQGPFAELPDGTAVRLPWGPGFEQALGETLVALALDPARRAQIGAQAKAAIGRLHAPEVTLAAYHGAIEAARAAPVRPWRRQTCFTYAPQQSRPGPEAPLWRQHDAVPAASCAGPSLALAKRKDLAALRALNHRPEPAAPGWLDRAAARGCDLIFLALTPQDKILGDPALAEKLNRLLSFDGVLVLALRGIAARAHKLAASTSGAVCLVAAGFRVELVASAAPPGFAEQSAPARDEIVWRAVKISEFIARNGTIDDAA